jgi:hypothetical protein
VDLTLAGKKMLENFLLGVCGFTGTFCLADRLEKCIQNIKQVLAFMLSCCRMMLVGSLLKK